MTRCEHGFDHHSGPHACDRDEHLNQCPYWLPEGYKPSSNVRTETLEHNHIFQAKTINGYWDCPACQTIDPLKMRWEYVQFHHQVMLKNKAGEWL